MLRSQNKSTPLRKLPEIITVNSAINYWTVTALIDDVFKPGKDESLKANDLDAYRRLVVTRRLAIEDCVQELDGGGKNLFERVARLESDWVTCSLASAMLKSCPDEVPLKGKVIQNSLTALRGMARRNIHVARTLAPVLFDACGNDPYFKEDVLHGTLFAFPTIAEAGYANVTESFLRLIAKKTGVSVRNFGLMAGRAPSNTAIVFSFPGGSRDRISYAMKEPGKQAIFYSGCFKGTGVSLLKRSEKMPNRNPADHEHYELFVKKAIVLLSQPLANLPKLHLEAYQKIGAMPFKRKRP